MLCPCNIIFLKLNLILKVINLVFQMSPFQNLYVDYWDLKLKLIWVLRAYKITVYNISIYSDKKLSLGLFNIQITGKYIKYITVFGNLKLFISKLLFNQSNGYN